VHGCSSLVFVVCCVGSGLCDELITRAEESYRVSVCVSNCVGSRNSQTGGVGPSWAVALQKKKWLDMYCGLGTAPVLLSSVKYTVL
jgi:hypothetical protein